MIESSLLQDHSSVNDSAAGYGKPLSLGNRSFVKFCFVTYCYLQITKFRVVLLLEQTFNLYSLWFHFIFYQSFYIAKYLSNQLADNRDPLSFWVCDSVTLRCAVIPVWTPCWRLWITCLMFMTSKLLHLIVPLAMSTAWHFLSL